MRYHYNSRTGGCGSIGGSVVTLARREVGPIWPSWLTAATAKAYVVDAARREIVVDCCADNEYPVTVATSTQPGSDRLAAAVIGSVRAGARRGAAQEGGGATTHRYTCTASDIRLDNTAWLQ
jgi:hypothetical protein